MKNIHQLALVLVKTLYLNVEDGTRVHIDSVVFLNVFCQANLVLVLDVHKLLLALRIIRIDRKAVNMRQIGNPLIPDLSRHPLSQQRIAVKQEPSLGYSVCLVVELLRHHLVEVF